MTAPEKLHRVVRMHKGSEFAIKDKNTGWERIHRISSVTQLSVREFGYTTDCRLHIESVEKVWPLSSGQLLGDKCVCCWPAPVSVESIRRATLVELITVLGRLQPLSDPFALKLARDCWSCIADLELGCRCEESAHTLVLSAEHWLVSR